MDRLPPFRLGQKSTRPMPTDAPGGLLVVVDDELVVDLLSEMDILGKVLRISFCEKFFSPANLERRDAD
jgi:hypothetical protein